MKLYSKNEAKSEITRLVDAFGHKLDYYKSDQYKEANLEDDYLKPFLRYLNWNASNEGIVNIANREVIVQAKGKLGKEPDYLLQLDGKPKFYIEAKHPKYKLWKEVQYMWQAYSYAYSTQSSSDRKKVDFSLLTDFEEFRFFDCTFKTDKKTVNNFVSVDWTFKDYETEFNQLWDLFEKENIRKGSLATLYLSEKKVKENRIPPDKAFLDDLDNEKTGWRIQIAKEIKKHNPGLSAEYITRAVQLIIDRFIFIKVLSDREIEDDYLSEIITNIDKALMKSEDALLIDSCKDVFSKLNRIYNGSIFVSKPELETIHISNKVLKNVLSDLLPENSRYNFKQLPVEVLGTIYEQFLGKVIQTTDKRVTVEYKPEVRKAGGVYYTPQYIVEYIVENTVGEKLKECKTLEDVFALKICDPACGSGSFLLGAYDRLLRWCVEYFSKTIKSEAAISKKNAEHVYRDEDGQLRLTSKLCRDLLRNCIFGVDIDSQAVEVAITSLSLKALEGTRHDELYAEVNLFHETVLPKLEDNIKCGNSLIGMDIFDGKLEFSKEEERKLNPFDWEKSFPGVFKKGGFDCVIGNPPYIQSRSDFIEKSHKDYFYSNYKTSEYQINTYGLFVEKSINILKHKGIMGIIIPNYWLSTDNDEKLRKYIFIENDAKELLNVYSVFDQATVDTLLLFVERTVTTKFPKSVNIKSISRNFKSIEERLDAILNRKWDFNEEYLINDAEQNISIAFSKTLKIKSDDYLKNYFIFKFGMKPYEEGKGIPPQTRKMMDNKIYDSKTKIDDSYKPLLRARNIQHYYTRWEHDFIKYGDNLAASRDYNIFTGQRIIIQRILSGSKVYGVYLDEEYICNTDVITLKQIKNELNIRFYLGILLSNFCSFYLRSNNINLDRKAFPKINTNTFEEIKIMEGT